MNATRRGMLTTFATLAVATQRKAFADAQGRGQPTVQAAGPPVDLDAAKKELPNALNALIRFEVARRGARLVDDGVRAVELFVQKGVDTLVDRGELVSVFSVSIAIDGARRFGNEIVNEANRANQSIREIGANIVTAVNKRLCPMYPFC